MRDAFLVACNAAWDWSEHRDVPVEVWRDDDDGCRWKLTLTFRDAYGFFTATVAVPAARGHSGDEEGTAKDMASEYVARWEKLLDDACQRAREQRIRRNMERLK